MDERGAMNKGNAGNPTSTVKPSSKCKIKPGPLPKTYEVKADDEPITIKLCKNQSGDPATVVEFDSVKVTDHSSGKVIDGQPTSKKSSSFDLNLKVGVYDVAMTIKPASGASMGTKAVAYVYESCDKPNPLGYIDTAVSWGDSFRLEVKRPCA
jgi:hypothetical protein